MTTPTTRGSSQPAATPASPNANTGTMSSLGSWELVGNNAEAAASTPAPAPPTVSTATSSPNLSPPRDSHAHRSASATAVEGSSLPAGADGSRGGLAGGKEGLDSLLRRPRRKINARMPYECNLSRFDAHNADAAREMARPPLKWYQVGWSRVGWGAPFERSGAVYVEKDSYPTLRDWVPQGRWDALQLAYIIIPQSILAALISGGINFGVAVACYNHLPIVYFWPFNPLTVAGDLGVTIVIQQVVSMLITSTMVHSDLVKGKVLAPLEKPWPPLMRLPGNPVGRGGVLGTRIDPQRPHDEGSASGKGPKTRFALWFLRTLTMGSERNDLSAPGLSWRQRVERILWTAVQGAWLAVLTFPWFWGIGIAILAPIYEHGNMGGGWIPPIIKLVYGGLLSLITNPIMALLAMGAESSVRRAYPDSPFWSSCQGSAEDGGRLTSSEQDAEVEKWMGRLGGGGAEGGKKEGNVSTA